MKTFAKIAATAAILGAVALPLQSANAWWGGMPGGGSGGVPWSGMTDMFGDVDSNFSSRGWGRGAGSGYPHSGYGYGPGSGGYGYPGYGGYPGMAPGYGGYGGYGGYPGMAPGYGGYPGGYAAPRMVVPHQAPVQ